MLSIFKPLLRGAVLARVDANEEDLNRRIRCTPGELVPHSPLTGRYPTSGMTVRELCDATITVNDNTPAAILETLENCLFGDVLKPASAARRARTLDRIGVKQRRIGDFQTRLPDILEEQSNKQAQSERAARDEPDFCGRRLSRARQSLAPAS